MLGFFNPFGKALLALKTLSTEDISFPSMEISLDHWALTAPALSLEGAQTPSCLQQKHQLAKTWWAKTLMQRSKKKIFCLKVKIQTGGLWEGSGSGGRVLVGTGWVLSGSWGSWRALGCTWVLSRVTGRFWGRLGRCGVFWKLWGGLGGAYGGHLGGSLGALEVTAGAGGTGNVLRILRGSWGLWWVLGGSERILEDTEGLWEALGGRSDEGARESWSVLGSSVIY